LLALVVSHATEYGDAVRIGPVCTPSAKNRTSRMPTLSDALALIVIVPETVPPDAGAVMAVTGGVLSAVPVTVAAVVRFPAASRATAVSVCDPLLVVPVFHVTEYGAVVSSAPRSAPSILNWTPTTATLSDAVAWTSHVPDTTKPEDGDDMLTVGGVESLDTVTATAAERSISSATTPSRRRIASSV